MRKVPFILMTVATFLGLAGLHAQTAANTQNPQRKVLIVVENHASPTLNNKISALEDLVASRVAGRGFSVVSRDVAVNALKTYRNESVSSSSQSAAHTGTTSAPEHAAAESETDRSGSTSLAATPETTQLDQALSDNTSALRLAQNLNVDFILVPAFTSYGTEKKSYHGNGIQTLNTIHRLHLNYKLVETGDGGAVRGGTVTATSTTRDTGNLQTDSNDVLNELLNDAANQLAALVVSGAKSLPVQVTKTGMVSFQISCSMTDPRQQPILVPDITISSDNQVIATNHPVAVQPMDVTVELDGVALGSAPGKFQARPGLHKLRLSREGFSDWARTVNIYEGQTLHVAMQMSPAGYARWKDTTRFLSHLDANRKLTDAEVKRIEGIGEFFKNSHYRVDTKEGTKIYKSIY